MQYVLCLAKAMAKYKLGIKRLNEKSCKISPPTRCLKSCFNLDGSDNHDGAGTDTHEDVGGRHGRSGTLSFVS